MRKIGPIPSFELPPGDGLSGDVFYHPGGPAPKWGGYSPIPIGWNGEERDPFTEGEVAKSKARTSNTRLVFQKGQWYIFAPKRFSFRCAGIADGALRDGLEPSSITSLGIYPEEVAAARCRIVRGPWKDQQVFRGTGTIISFGEGSSGVVIPQGEVAVRVYHEAEWCGSADWLIGTFSDITAYLQGGNSPELKVLESIRRTVGEEEIPIPPTIDNLGPAEIIAEINLTDVSPKGLALLARQAEKLGRKDLANEARTKIKKML